MRLTLVIYSLNAGGAERVLSDLANHWAAFGHDVSMVTLVAPDTEPFYPLSEKIQLIQLDNYYSGTSILKRIWHVGNRMLALRGAIKNIDPDVVISFIDLTNMTTLIVTRGLGKPVVVSERTHPFYYHIPVFYQKLRLLFYPTAAHVVVQTQGAADYFTALKNVTVIPNGIPRLTLVRSISDDILPKNIISVGRLCASKSFDILIRAFSRLLKTHPHLTLTIYGEGSERQNLESLITSLNLTNQVHLPGTTHDIGRALAAGDLFIFPSQFEGFPNALCEAMAAGLPVIASNCSGNTDVVRDGIDGRLFPVGDESALIRITQELLNDPTECARLSENAKTICDRFHPDRIYDLWDRVILDAAGNNRN